MKQNRLSQINCRGLILSKTQKELYPQPYLPVLRIRIREIHMFLGLPVPDPHPDPLVRDIGSGSFYRQAKIVRKTLIPTVL
jgi:hypothetical protein